MFKLFKFSWAVILATTTFVFAGTYEGFDYDLGLSVIGQNGGTGWTNAWFKTSGEDADAAIAVPLTWQSPDEQDLPVIGNALRLSPTTASVINAKRNFEPITNTVYFSFLVSPITGHNGYDYNYYIGNGSDGLYLIARGWGAQNWLVGGFTEDNRPAELPLPAVGTTQLMVGKLNMIAGICQFWSNPDLSNPGAPSYTQTGYEIDFVDSIKLYQQSNATMNNKVTNSFDELKVGRSFSDVIPIMVPTDVVASQGTYPTKVVIDWTGVNGASTYSVFRSEQDDHTTAVAIGQNIVSKSFDDTTCANQVVYYYWVTSNLGPDLFGPSVSGYCVTADLPAQPVNVVASTDLQTPVVNLSWDIADKATKYVVYRSKSLGFDTAMDVSGELVNTLFSDTNVVQGLMYYYWIKAGNVSGWSFPSDPVIGGTEYTASICYENFDYPAGADLTDQVGGFGFDGEWIISGEGEIIIGTEGLIYPGLQTSGKSALALGLGVSGGSLSGIRETLKDFAGADTVWYSFLFQPYKIGTGHAYLIPNGDWNSGSGRYWSDFICLHQKETDIPLEQGRTYLLVVKSSPDGTYLWVDPSLENEPLVGAAGTSYTTSMPNGNSLNINISPYPLAGTNGFYYDEIRVGSTFAKVTPNYLVKNVQASDGAYNDKVAITWSLRSDATNYVVYRNSNEDSSTATAVSGDLTLASFDDTTATPGEVYFYWIYATFDDGQQAFSYSDSGYRSAAGAPFSPANVVASDSVPNQKYISVTYDASAGATGYRVYRNTMDDYATAVNVSGDTLGTSYDDSNVRAGVQYYYWARAYNASGVSVFSDSDSGSVPALLVAYYAMNEFDSTNMYDSSENEFDGIYRGDGTEIVLGVPSADAALYETAVQFYIGDGVINSNTPIRELTNNFTVAMWLKPDEWVNTEYRYLLGLESETGGWSVQAYNKQVLLDITGKGNAWAAEIPNTQEWCHIAFTYDVNNIAYPFVDGVVGDKFIIGSPADFVVSTTYIANGGTDQLYLGSIDEVRVYDGVLTDFEIATLAGVPEPTTVSFLLLSLISLLVYRRN